MPRQGLHDNPRKGFAATVCVRVLQGGRDDEEGLEALDRDPFMRVEEANVDEFNGE
jgi:hypothetical protein